MSLEINANTNQMSLENNLMGSFQNIPLELLYQIFSHLDLNDLSRLSRVNTVFYNVIKTSDSVNELASQLGKLLKKIPLEKNVRIICQFPNSTFTNISFSDSANSSANKSDCRIEIQLNNLDFISGQSALQRSGVFSINLESLYNERDNSAYIINLFCTEKIVGQYLKLVKYFKLVKDGGPYYSSKSTYILPQHKIVRLLVDQIDNNLTERNKEIEKKLVVVS